jgi:SAM-dependent methyltransferase
MDPSNGYEYISNEFQSLRGRSRSTGIGVSEVRNWARTLPKGSSVIDLGCGPGLPITSALVDEGLHVFGVDASPSLADAFQQNLPGIPILCEPVQTSSCFHRTFDAALAWGLIFLLSADDQHRLIQRFAAVLNKGGRLLFTSPAKAGAWNDVMTKMESISLGAEQYRKLLEAAGLSIQSEYEDDGQNHYYEASKL